MLQTPRLISITAIGGAVLLFVGTYLHPSASDPNVPRAAFAEYATDSTWIASHLIQLVGASLSIAVLVLVGLSVGSGPGQVAATLATLCAAVSLLGVALLQDRRFPRLFGPVALASGVPTVVAGIAIATADFRSRR